MPWQSLGQRRLQKGLCKRQGGWFFTVERQRVPRERSALVSRCWDCQPPMGRSQA